MAKIAASRLLVLFVAAGLSAAGSRASARMPQNAVAKRTPELAAAAELAVQQGMHAELPPHISTLLGLTDGQKCKVLQGVLRSNGAIKGIEIAEANHNDIIIFDVNEATSNQTFYLTSPTGSLRKLLSVKQGTGHVLKPMKADVEAFEKEKQMWEGLLKTKELPR